MLDKIKLILAEKFGQDVILDEDAEALQPSLTIEATRIADICQELRDNPATWFDFLSSLTGVDYGIESGEFGVVYHLSSIPHKTQFVLKVRVPGGRNIDELPRSEEHTSELQSLMRRSYAVFCLKKKQR